MNKLFATLIAILTVITSIPAQAGDWRYRDHNRYERHHTERHWRRERSEYRYRMQPRYQRHYYTRRHDTGGALAGFIAGAIVGAVLNKAAANHENTMVVTPRCTNTCAQGEVLILRRID